LRERQPATGITPPCRSWQGGCRDRRVGIVIATLAIGARESGLETLSASDSHPACRAQQCAPPGAPPITPGGEHLRRRRRREPRAWSRHVGASSITTGYRAAIDLQHLNW